ncbi:ADP-ribosylglycohydrolase family protein [Stieleria sp. TO1_6]|uniref:ADP-ribosylglycohydrolase family protein n=1 Tax=Stieleria tagensis TaxID=2956795 RepID=UPI00209B8972|nr:ADP-ribosylglycohydrolase family protein [Stieleria tagensis]MCO8123510.1 ADP-ribosylglycohydrolase family protein [Stieleria tagensis]
MNRDAIIGCVLGTAIGDALGLPYEGVSPQRAQRLLGPPDRNRFFFGRGMVSDDTEHTCMVAQSLIEAHDDVDIFTKRFARRLRWWILALPAGVGKATARAGVKLWVGVKPKHAGVFSAGNGPAMRAAIMGAAIDDVPLMLEMVRASSRLTHSDPKAEYGAIAVALAAKHSRDHDAVDANLWLAQVVDAIGDEGEELANLLRKAVESVRVGDPTKAFAKILGLEKGVTGYTYHTVPVAIHAWLSHPKDFPQAVTTMIGCGGDADTTAAIVGGIVGTGVGRTGVPDEWIDGLWEWPRSVTWMCSLGESLADSIDGKPNHKVPSINPLSVLVRNLLFLFVVLFHGFRRLAPPY